MGFRFRKSIRILPGVRINIGKKGVSGISIGKRGTTVTVNEDGVRGTVGIPGTGVSYSEKITDNKDQTTEHGPGALTIIFLIAALLLIVIFIFA